MGRKCPVWALLYTLVFTGAASAEKRVTVADCRFSANPEEFLGRAARIRADAFARTTKFNGSAKPAAASSLPQRNFIDQEVLGRLAKENVPAAPIASDEEFLRRLYLDLTGRIPSPDDIRTFTADSASDKRDKLIDRLLASSEFADRWTMWMGDLLQNTSTLVNAAVNRNPQGRNAFHTYIRNSVASDKPLKAIAAEVVSAKGNNFDDATGASNFPLGASTSMGPVQDTYDTMLVKTATTFLGLGSYDCLLCHNGRGHLTELNLWGTGQTRNGAWGMAAFFSRMSYTPSSPNRSMMISDSDAGAYDLGTDSGNRPNRVPTGGISSVLPVYRETLAIPKDGSWRAAFAENMVADPMFARNLANRIWKQMFGLALVDPVDSLDPARLDPANPPADPWTLQASHPELLEKLAAELNRQDFRLKGFLRVLAQSTSYQLSSRADGEWKEEWTGLFARRIPRRLEGEEVHDAIAKATGILGDYAPQNFPGRVAWAVQLPEPLEPTGDRIANGFMSTFLRGDRDTQERSQSGSIQQQLALMNDPFVLDRLRAGLSPKLRALVQMTRNEDMLDEMYLTFLSRLPSAAERTANLASLAKAGDRSAAIEDLAWMCINKVEFLFSY